MAGRGAGITRGIDWANLQVACNPTEDYRCGQPWFYFGIIEAWDH